MPAIHLYKKKYVFFSLVEAKGRRFFALIVGDKSFKHKVTHILKTDNSKTICLETSMLEKLNGNHSIERQSSDGRDNADKLCT